MNKGFRGVLLAVALISTHWAQAGADMQSVDVLFLRDGTSVEGLIVDQNLGESIKVVTYERTLLSFEQNEIERIEKREAAEPIPVAFTDAIVLLDGVIFRGDIVEQKPGELLVLKTANGLFLTFPYEDVWKIVKQRIVAASAAAGQEAPDPVEAATLELKIVLQQKNLRNRLSERKQGTAGESEGLREQIDALTSEINQLQEDKDRLVQEQIDQQLPAERTRLEELRAVIERLLEEMKAILKQCEGAGESPAAAAPLSRLQLRPDRIQVLFGFGDYASSEAQIALQAGQAGERSALLEVIDEALKTTEKKLPTPAEVAAALEMQKSRDQLEVLLESGEWRLSSNQELVKKAVGQLSSDERLFLYQAHRSRELVPSIFLNAALYPSFIGSWRQGDKRGAIIGYLHSLGAGLGAAYLILGIPGNYRWEVVGRQSAMHYLPVPQGDGWYGVALVAASFVASVLQPVLFEHGQNRHLVQALKVAPRDSSIRRSRVRMRPPALTLQPVATGHVLLNASLVSLYY